MKNNNFCPNIKLFLFVYVCQHLLLATSYCSFCSMCDILKARTGIFTFECTVSFVTLSFLRIFQMFSLDSYDR